MKSRFVLQMVTVLVVVFLWPGHAAADPDDSWWNEGWPYRIKVTVGSTGIAEVQVDFTAVFAAQLVQSRTLFSRVPTDLEAARKALVEQLTGGIFSDGFESGDASRWTAALP